MSECERQAEDEHTHTHTVLCFSGGLGVRHDRIKLIIVCCWWKRIEYFLVCENMRKKWRDEYFSRRFLAFWESLLRKRPTLIFLKFTFFLRGGCQPFFTAFVVTTDTASEPRSNRRVSSSGTDSILLYCIQYKKNIKIINTRNNHNTGVLLSLRNYSALIYGRLKRHNIKAMVYDWCCDADWMLACRCHSQLDIMHYCFRFSGEQQQTQHATSTAMHDLIYPEAGWKSPNSKTIIVNRDTVFSWQCLTNNRDYHSKKGWLSVGSYYGVADAQTAVQTSTK